MNTQHNLNISHQRSTDLKTLIKAYWSLIKSKQTYLLVITGWAGFSSAQCPITGWETTLALIGSLFLAISGSTIFNMAYDRDIDAKMARAANRPLPSGLISLPNAILFASIVSALGIGWAFTLDPLYGWIVMAGLFFDAVIYTVVLKRRTPYSIIYGGISGGMPILAGRTLGVGSIDLIGILLAAAIVFWIPTHIMTFSIKYQDQYAAANVPTFPSVYGVETTRKIIAGSTVIASLIMILAAELIGIKGYYLISLILGSIALVSLATLTVMKPSQKLNFRLFKAASIYMLGAMLLIGLAL